MTPEDVRASIASIDVADDEDAHEREDGIRASVLEAIAQGADNASELARAALETSTLVFYRWYA